MLLDFRGVESTWELSGGTVSAAEFGRFWSKSPVADRLCRGQITPEQFAAEAVAEWCMQVTPVRFLVAFRQWLKGPCEGAFELLAELRIAICWPASASKPDPSCYRYVLQRLNARVADVIFFDDSHECVAGARMARIAAHQCVGISALVQTLAQLGLLDEDA